MGLLCHYLYYFSSSLILVLDHCHKALSSLLVSAPNGLAFSCGERAALDHIKTGTISRAKRSAAMPGSAASHRRILTQYAGVVQVQTAVRWHHQPFARDADSLCRSPKSDFQRRVHAGIA